MLYWLTEQPNVQLILGNHEAMLLSCEFIFEEITSESIDKLDENKIELLNNYMLDGGSVTLKGLKKLTKEQRKYVLEYLHDCPLYETVSVNGHDYLLVHSGIDNFDPEKPLEDYTPDELLWAWPDLEDSYYTDIITIFGHTPTKSFGEEYRGKILRTKTWIDIDVGAGFGEEPVLFRQDDEKEFCLKS